MAGMRALIILGTIAVILLGNANLTDACNEAVCGSVVSKCILKQACKCDVTTCSCCKQCYACLGDLYTECCSCFDLCPALNASNTSLNDFSYVEDLATPLPRLFRALTSEPDPEERWISFSYQDSYFSFSKSSTKTKSCQSENSVHKIECDVQKPVKSKKSHTHARKCTVAFISECTSLHKCKTSCMSLGASSLRWFHDGCCECIGKNCSNYGMNKSTCSRCPKYDYEEEPEDNYDDYGQHSDEDDEDHDDLEPLDH